MILAAGKYSIALDRPRVMGVLNVTPDSFSDGGQFLSKDDAISHAASLIKAGADIVDVGGESTRPGAAAITVQQELDRVMPVVEVLADCVEVPISIDTSKPDVMRAAVNAGASLINDVYALRKDGALEAAAELDAAVCLMHMQGDPADMQENPHYGDVVSEVGSFLDERVQACLHAGFSGDRLIVDPGFGFGKHDVHNLSLLARLDQLMKPGIPMLVGLSRKRMLGNLTGRPVEGRVAAGVAAATMAVAKGARIVRTHDVAVTVDALNLIHAIEQAGND